MIIDNQRKYDYSDVLLVPQRSELNSRDEVDLVRSFTTKWGKKQINGIPIIASNMWNVASPEMAYAMADANMFTALHKFYSPDDLREVTNDYIGKNIFITIGESRDELDRLFCYTNLSIMPMFCIDVANGYRAKFVKYIAKLRKDYDDIVLMVGNVTTPEMTQELILAGADIVKIGIGPGCFVAKTKVKTKTGYKSIEKIRVGDEVLTHDGSYKKVEVTTSRVEKDQILTINNIQCTKNHEFYVINKKNAEFVNEDNLEKYAEWVSAEDLSDDYFLVKITE